MAVLMATEDPNLAALANDAEVTTLSAEDNFVLGMRGHNGQVFAYDPVARVSYPIEVPKGAASFYPLYTSGTTVLGALRDESERERGEAIVDIVSGPVAVVQTVEGFGYPAILGLNEGFAFGVARGPAKPSTFPKETRAVVVDLATGKVTDITPSGGSGPIRAEAHGVSDGQALVLVFADTPEEPTLSRIEVVDLATGAHSVASFTAEQLAAISDEFEGEGSLKLEHGRISGYFVDDTGGPSHPFQYDLATGTIGPGPCGMPVDPGRFLCTRTEGSSPARAVSLFISDVEHGTETPLPWPEIGSEYPVQDVADGRILLSTEARSPVVYDARTGSAYLLDWTTVLDGQLAPIPSSLAIVGNVIVASTRGRRWTDGRFDPRVWRLP